MTTLTVQTSREYEIHIGSGLLSQLGDLVSPFIHGRNAAIISDSNVWPIYGEGVISSLRAAGFEVTAHVIPAGEDQKNLNTYAALLNFLADKQFCRDDVIVALGGGVVGDLAGFTAATFLRGIAYIQIPTTLLGMVDSSVGGKTAVNLPSGKNLAGAFYQPALVLCDTDTISTLPQKTFLDGCAEVIKYGILFDEVLFQDLVEKGPAFDLERVIARCAELKSMVVCADEFEQGQRKLLNLGHTFAHAIELLSNYQISHGHAVSIGIAMAARAAKRINLCNQDTALQILNALTRFGLPVSTDFTAQQLYQASASDKKRHSNKIDLILPEAIGHCTIRTVELQELLSYIEAGL